MKRDDLTGRVESRWEEKLSFCESVSATVLFAITENEAAGSVGGAELELTESVGQLR